MLDMKKEIKCLFLVVILCCLASCSSLTTPLQQISQSDDEVFSTPMREAKVTNEEKRGFNPASEPEEGEFRVLSVPSLSIKDAAKNAEILVIPKLSEKNSNRVSFNNMPIGVFINELFSNQLGLNYIIEPGISDIQDLVTMRLNSTVSPEDLYSLATRTLRAYGVTTSVRDDTLFFSYAPEAAKNEIPLIISGKALPNVPPTSRPIFYIYPTRALKPNNLRATLKQMFPAKDLTIEVDVSRNALVFRGPLGLVNQAAQATLTLDVPTIRGMLSRVFRPTLNNVTKLANDLENVLNAQGYYVTQEPGPTAIRLLPLQSVNQLIVFTQSTEVLNHVIAWAKMLEEESYGQVEQGLFSYQVRTTSAMHIVNVIRNLGIANFVSSSVNKTPVNATSTPQASITAHSNNRLAVDEQLNTILFSGNGADWLKILPTLKDLDKPAPSVMVEVVMAEIQLNDSEQGGIEWLANSTADGFGLNYGTLNGLGVGGSGFRLTLDNAGATRALLNFFYKNEKAVIRSRPRLMVKSGGTASIDVGNEIPIITTNTQGIENNNAPIVQSISYRKTGVLLDIEPIVHAAGFVEIGVSQELSEATATSSSNIDSPTILNRKINTTVTLQDGGSVLIGGLISSTSSEGSQGIPVLDQVPILKRLLRQEANEKVRTELMIMIIPYILSSPEEAEELTDELQRARMKLLGN
ncbi:MAG: type II and III secretion system protein [Crocinitomicaceae bacterium]|nr:type II and III secretion system protein [Crocinitomicaceae bacterium]